MGNYIVSFFISYFIGSIPTAYLVVKGTSDVDIRNVGSGNVGGRNALEVTGKKWIGVVVTIVDLLKGVVSVLIGAAMFDDAMAPVSAAMFGSVLGHCYPVWLKFHGGRGLATGAGALLATSAVWVGLWLVFYFGFEKITKNVHASSVIALVILPPTMYFLPDQWLSMVIPGYFTPAGFFAAGSSIVAVCLSRHIEPIKEYFHE
ncbi:MAG: glycerol-3-phosphate acyltransferase [Bacteroidota bacterium]